MAYLTTVPNDDQAYRLVCRGEGGLHAYGCSTRDALRSQHADGTLFLAWNRLTDDDKAAIRDVIWGEDNAFGPADYVAAILRGGVNEDFPTETVEKLWSICVLEGMPDDFDRVEARRRVGRAIGMLLRGEPGDPQPKYLCLHDSEQLVSTKYIGPFANAVEALRFRQAIMLAWRQWPRTTGSQRLSLVMAEPIHASINGAVSPEEYLDDIS